MTFTFVPAVKHALKARLAFEGVAGGGKTYSALAVASHLGDSIAVIDTEHKSALLYADLFRFDWLGLDRFAPDALVEALAAASGHDTAIVDSWSHFWMGTDGMLEQVDRAGKRSGSGNSFGGWKEMRPAERRMVDAMLSFPGHLIVTLRTKTDWVVEENERGKKQPRKIGLKAEQREGLEYDFTIVGQLDFDNNLIISKSRCPALSGAVVHKPGEEFARTLRDWLESGEKDGPSATDIRDEACDDSLTVDELKALYDKAEAHGRAGTAITTDTGDTATLGDFIRGKALEAKKRAAAAKEVRDA